MLEAIKMIKEQKIEHGDVQFIITVGEEAGLVGAKQLRSFANLCQIRICL